MPIINPGFGGPLLLTQGQVGSVGNGFPPQGPPPMMANGTGMMPMMTGFPGVY
jgi:clathrin heavy chain